MHDIERVTLARVVAAAVVRDEPQNLLKHLPCDGDLGHLEDNIAAVAHHLRAVLDQLVLQGRQRPVLDRLRRRQRAQEIAEVVGEGMKLAAPRWRRTFGTTVASTCSRLCPP